MVHVFHPSRVMAYLRDIRRLLGKLLAQNVQAVRAHRERRRGIARADIDWDSFVDTVHNTHEPVFVLSTGRCGTTLLTEILHRTPGVLCEHSPNPELVAVERDVHARGLDDFDEFRAAISTARFELIADAHLRGRRYIETNCRITFFAPHLAALFPRAKFIHLIRHPGSFVRSAVRRGFYRGNYFDIGRIRPCSGDAADQWNSMSDYERTAWLWNETNQYIERFKTTVEGRVLTVKAEDLFASTDTTIELLQFLKLPVLPDKTISKLIRRPVNPQSGGDVPPVKEWDRDRINAVLNWAPLTYRYGYEFQNSEPQRMAS